MKIKMYVDPGMLLPWYYGFAYYEYFSGRTVVYVIPFNVFIQLARYVYKKSRTSIFSFGSDIESVAYEKGVLDGYEKGYKEGGLQAQEQIEKMFNQIQSLVNSPNK